MSQTSTNQHQQPAATSPAQPRPARSRNGCNACRRRKVRCNEQRPRCSHCERLNLDCTWHRAHPARKSSTISQPCQSLAASSPHGQHQSFTSAVFPFDGYGFGFEFSGPLNMGTWDEAMLLSPTSFPTDSLAAAAPSISQPSFSLQSAAAVVKNQARDVLDRRQYHPDQNLASPLSTEGAPDTRPNEELLLNSFLQMLMPPILTPVEVGPKWASTRAFFATMAAESPLVKSAIMAFAAMQIERSGLATGTAKFDWRSLYDSTVRQLPSHTTRAIVAENADGVSRSSLKHVLAALFLLTYTDLLTETLPRAHANLREAYMLIQKTKKTAFSIPERRLVSWLRLLDARAVSTAGGEGLFLTDTDETIFSASPAADAGPESDTLDIEIEEVLFDVLYEPGLRFFHQVQTFSGRITRIDPWSRSRGTVEDETEVMALAAQISKDLHALYAQRPVLMDHAVAGNLTEKHLAKNLAGPLTRSFRCYLVNYYACFLHLHRVAYKSYPKTKDVVNAIANIKRLCHLMAESHESLPVNVLWPLLMWGCEEEDVEERKWILEAIRNLSTEATNAKATANLLEVVQKRQDEGGTRVDCRLVSSELFASSNHFAIV